MRTVWRSRPRAPLLLATSLALAGTLVAPGLGAPVEAASRGAPEPEAVLNPPPTLDDHRDDLECFRIRTRHGRERVCIERERHEGRRRSGDWNRWARFWHDDFGDCFATPWGLACETRRPGVYRVIDFHPGDEPGPDCDRLIIEPWGWRCYDSPRR